MAALLRDPRYRLFLGAAGAANLGDGIGALAFPWVAMLPARDPAWIAFVAFAGRLPWLLLSLPAGVLTDRADRRRLIARADAARAALAAGVVAVAASSRLAGEAAPGGVAPILALAGIGFLFGAAEVVRDNAAQTALPGIVTPGELERANGQLLSVERVAGAFVGPPLAGLLIAWAVPAPFLAQVAAFGAAALCVRALPGMVPVRAAPRSVWVEAREGLAWMGAHRLVLRLALLTGAGNFLGAMSMTVPVLLSQEALGLDAAGHGLLLTAGVMAAAEPMLGREAALRVPYWIGFGGACGIFAYAAARLRLR